MLSFELDEQVTEEELNSIRLTSEYFYTAISKSIENDKDNKNYDNLKRAFEDSRSGINKKLINIDRRFAMPRKKDNVKKYEIFKLRKMIYDFEQKYNEYKIFQILNKPSYRTIKYKDKRLNSKQSDYLDELNKRIETGMKYQINSKDNNVKAFIKDVQKCQNDFINEMNTAIVMPKRVRSYNDGVYCTEEYYKNIYCVIDGFIKVAKTLEPNIYSTFELFYQVVESKKAIGGLNSQQYISRKILKIIEKGINPISKEASEKFINLNIQEEVSNLEDYIKEQSRIFAPIVFDGEDITVEEGIQEIENNANDLSICYMISQTEFANPSNTVVNQLALVALCRAFFVKEKNQGSPLLKMKFSVDGYYSSEEKEKRRSTLYSYIKNCAKDSSERKKSASRMILEIINFYMCVYGNKVDYLKRRLELENKFDKMMMKLFSYYDYNILNKVFDICYDDLVGSVLPKEFLREVYKDMLKFTNLYISYDTTELDEETYKSVQEYFLGSYG